MLVLKIFGVEHDGNDSLLNCVLISFLFIFKMSEQSNGKERKSLLSL